MAVTGLDHVQLAIPAGGEDRARALFVGVLGMREVEKPPRLSREGCWFEGGGAAIHIGIDRDFHPATKAHPALLVADLEATKLALEQSGYPIEEDKPIAGYDRIFTSDSFGNRIELMQKLS